MIGQVALVVRDYDEAIAYFTQAFGFALLEDTRLSAEKRCVRVAPRGVKFVEAPRDEPYGAVVVFEDLYGNKWDLVQRRDRGAY